MKVYILFLLLVFIFLYINEKIFNIDKKSNISFLLTFFILGFFSAIRDDIGVDYKTYLIHIQKIALGNLNYMEKGFQYLVKLVMLFSNNPRNVIIVSSFITSFFFSKSIYEQSKNVKMSIFLFLTWGYYFFSFNTIRSFLAISICLFSIKFILKKKYFKFIFCILLATSIHKSALICLPMYVIANRKYSKNQYILILICSIIILLLKEQLRTLVFYIYPHYEGSVYDDGSISFLNIIKSVIVLLYSFLYYNKIKKDDKLNIYFNLNLLAFIIYTFIYWIPEVSRIGFYFNITAILLISNLTTLIRKKDRLFFEFLIYFFSFLLFIILMRTFYSHTIRLLPYKTWVF